VKLVTIESRWGGLGKPKNTEVLIRNQNGKFVGSDGRTVSTLSIESLLQSFSGSAVERPLSSNLGITQAWLNDNVEPATEKFRPSRYSLHFIQYDSTYRAAFTNLSFIDSLLPSIFRGFHTDDNLRVGVEVTLTNDNVWSAVSESQYEFMIPWRIKALGRTFTSYDANLSRAAGALLPDQGANRARLIGERFNHTLANQVMAHIEEQWMSPALALIRDRYTVGHADIDFGYSIDYGKEWRDGHPQEENMRVFLSRQDFPQLFRAVAFLPFREGTVYGTEDFLQHAPGYENLVLSIDWLSRSLNGNPTFVEMRFVQGRSFSDKAMAVFAADMRAIGKEALAKEVMTFQEHVALIVIHQGYWLVLPDKRMVLWRFGVPIRLLKWTPADFSTKECASYPQSAGKCVGAVVSAQGELISP